MSKPPKTYIPAGLDMVQSRKLAAAINTAVDELCKTPGVDRTKAELDMAMHCARYAYNHGVMDAHLETTDVPAPTPIDDPPGPGEGSSPPAGPGISTPGKRRGRRI